MEETNSENHKLHQEVEYFKNLVKSSNEHT